MIQQIDPSLLPLSSWGSEKLQSIQNYKTLTVSYFLTLKKLGAWK